MSTEGKLASRPESDNESAGFTAEDLAKIFHYPSIGHLFSDSNSTAIADFTSRITATRDELEKVVRHGNREEADRAGVVVKGINVTLDFIASLEQMRASEK